MHAGISGIYHMPGRPLRLDEPGWVGLNDQAARGLSDDGFAAVSVLDGSIEANLFAGLEGFFERCAIPRESVDNLLLASETVFGAAQRGAADFKVGEEGRREIPDRKRLVERLIERTGLMRARLIGLSGGGCANMSAALHLAVGLVQGGLSRTTLVVVIEQLATHEARVMDNLAAPLSDIVLCFAVHDGGDMQVTRCLQAVMPGVVKMKLAGEPLLQGLELARASRRIIDDAAQGEDCRRFAAITSDNFRRSFYDVALSAVNLSCDDLKLLTKAELGHAFGCEVLINAARLREEGRVGSGDELLLLTFGRSTLAATALRLAEKGP